MSMSGVSSDYLKQANWISKVVTDLALCIQILKVQTAPWANGNEPGLENTMLRILMQDYTDKVKELGV